ncbi:MAG: thioredoxin family protein [Candidatus Bipolaricaulia bacterium]
MKVEILGTGCPKCQKTEELVHQALGELDVEADVEHVTDPTAIADYGVFMTPGLVVDGEVKLSGKVPAVDDLKAMLQQSESTG